MLPAALAHVRGQRYGQNYYTYVADGNNRFALLGEDLLVVNQNTLQLLSDDGTIRYSLSVSMTTPMVSVGGDVAAVCDDGGQQSVPVG